MVQTRSSRATTGLLRLSRAPRSEAARLAALLRGCERLAAASDLDTILATALEQAMAFSGHEVGMALIPAPGPGTGDEQFLVRVVSGQAPSRGRRYASGAVVRGLEAELARRALRERRAIHQPAHERPGQKLPYESWLYLPLVGARPRAVGVLGMHSLNGMLPLAPDDLAVLEALGRQAGTAVENAFLHDDLQRTLDELLTLHGAGQAISTSLSLTTVLDGILEMSRRVVRAECCLISRLDERGDLVVLASSGGTAEWLSYRASPGVRLGLAAVVRDGTTRPLGIPPVTGWGTALKLRSQVIGVLEVYARGGPPRYDESHLLAGLATQAAIAIENATLYEAVREKELRLQDFIERMIQAQEDERRRVAYDIHDGLAQLIVSAHQHLQAYEALRPHGQPSAESELAKGLFLLQKSIEESRKVISGLRPSTLDDFGLVAALRLYAQEVLDEYGWQVELREELGEARLPATIETTVYRIVQEALTNARKHAGPGKARVELALQGDELRVEVRDWGSGFAASTVDGDGNGDQGRRIGLHSMRERAKLLGGSFDVESEPGEGTVIRAVIPLSTVQFA